MKVRVKYRPLDTAKAPLSGRPLPLIDVKLAGPARTLRMSGLIDSGAESTTIPDGVETSLELPITGKGKVSGIGGTVDTKIAEVDMTLLYEGKSILKINDYSVRVLPPSCALFCVILGRDTVFKEFIVTFDERNQEVTLERY